MRTSKKCLSLTLTCLIIGLNLSPAYGAETISVNLSDARAIIADNAALLAEIDALNSALTTERAQVKELVMKYNTALSADAALIDEYKAMNLTLTDTMTAKDKAAAARLRAEKAVSTHAPARGATASGAAGNAVVRFQLTRPRGARPQNLKNFIQKYKFQLTRPRGARLSLSAHIL